MGIWQYIKNLFSREEATGEQTSTEASPVAASSPRLGGHYYPLLGNEPMSVPTAYRCIDLLSRSVANLPLQFLRLRNDIFAPDVVSRLHFLLNVQPNETTNAFDFWERVVQLVLTDGNAYIVPIYSTTTPEVDRLVLCERGTVSHDTINDVYTITDMQNAVMGRYYEDEVIHIKGRTLNDSKVGVSVLTFARLTLNISSAGEQETLSRFVNGGNVRGIVSNDNSVRGFGEYQDEQLEKTATDIDKRFQNGEHIVSLPGQVQFSPISLSSTDMQFLESRKFTVRDVCRFFGVHPSFVFDDTSNNYKSAEMANVAFLSHTLNPILRKIESELLRKLVAPTLWGKRKFEFDREGLYAADLESRAKYQAATIAAGIYTVNEWRKKENKAPVEGGDKVLVSANLKDINEEVQASTVVPAKTSKNDKDDEEEQE